MALSNPPGWRLLTGHGGWPVIKLHLANGTSPMGKAI